MAGSIWSAAWAAGAKTPRDEFQDGLGRANAEWLTLDAADAPDGDADLEHADFSSFKVPACEACGGILKPDVVFFGENVPRDVVATAQDHLAQADAMLVVGSSLMVYSGFRFVQAAAKRQFRSPRSISDAPAPTISWRSRSRSAARRRLHSCSERAGSHPSIA